MITKNVLLLSVMVTVVSGLQSSNVALDKTAWQSDVAHGGDAARAVDGNKSSNWTDNSCSRTSEYHTQPYWAVDLAQNYAVVGVSITNRDDCCGNRLRNYTVAITISRPARVPVYKTEEICAHRNLTHIGTLNLKCYENITGQYLIIQRLSKGILTLCEVEVYADNLPDGHWVKGDFENMALNRRAWQTGTTYANGGIASRAVDGSMDVCNQGSCSHTTANYQPFWAVNLRQQYAVFGVRIHHCNRLENYNVAVTKSRPADPPRYEYEEICAYRKNGTDISVSLQCYKPITGKFVLVQLRDRGVLSLCEVEVYIDRFPDGCRKIGDFDNLAFNKTAWTTDSLRSQASWAVDADGTTCSDTNTINRPYWAVDLARTYTVTGLSITGDDRIISLGLRNYDVVVTKSRPADPPRYSTEDVCAYINDRWTHFGIRTLECYQPISGQYLLIQKKDQDQLALCEVEVYSDNRDLHQLHGLFKGDMENVALSKTAWQLDMLSNAEARRAVDGNNDGNFFNGSCSHTTERVKSYWAVDLAQTYTVAGVSIANRKDCCSSRLRNYDIVVTKSRPGDPPSYSTEEICASRRDTHNDTLNLECYKHITGQYVLIQLRYLGFLTLCEVAVYEHAGRLITSNVDHTYGQWIKGDFDNVAFNKTAWQSDVWTGSIARIAVDGNTDANYYGWSCAHTTERDQPYWAVDLAQTYTVVGVSITNRQDCCSDRLKHYNVAVTKSRPADPPSYSIAEHCAYRRDTHYDTLNLECYEHITGQYVLVQLRDRGFLTLCEVAVYADRLPDGQWVKEDVENVALFKPAWENDDDGNGEASRAVDGNPDGDFSHESCTSTDAKANPYWAVDLGESYNVYGVSITNRADCCSNRLKNYNVAVLNTRPVPPGIDYNSDEICAYRQDSHTGTINLKCAEIIRGHYVAVHRIGRISLGILTLCEVAVYADRLPDGEWVQGVRHNSIFEWTHTGRNLTHTTI